MDAQGGEAELEAALEVEEGLVSRAWEAPVYMAPHSPFLESLYDKLYNNVLEVSRVCVWGGGGAVWA